ncbi:tRNA (adenosine(37)-N6)-threonylcarbamoyltransferase complex dimerization subunit type 1 TsaB [Meridianimarinicoccus sp. RP-17]
MVTLAFDTSGPACCAAILSGETIIADTVEQMARGQAERLFPLLDELLSAAGLAWGDVGRIGVGTGPGNFTGIRISVAAARGLALSLGCPAIGVSTLDALAHGLPQPCLTVVPARRGSIYLQRHRQGEVHAPETLTLDELAAAALPPVPVCGDVANDVAARIGGTVVRPAAPHAVSIARIACARAADTADRPRPLYLRAADAAPASDRPPAILP